MEKVISQDGTKIAYNKYGSGPLVVLVGGAMGHTKMGFFKPLAELLASDFTVIDYDRRGRNESSDMQPYAVEKEVQDIEALIKANGGSAYLFGISSGAALALRATAVGLDIRKLALYDPPYTGKTMTTPYLNAIQEVSQLVDQGKRGDAVAYFMRMVGLPGIAVMIMRIMPFWGKLKAVAHTLIYDFSIMGDGMVPVSMASKIAIPSLVMSGGKSPASLTDPAQELAKAIPNSQYKSLEGQTHNVSMKVIAPFLIEFFKK